MSEPKPVPSEKVTILDVAADAGVSKAAVSKVLRNAYGVSDAMRDNVMESIRKLGYRPSTAARGMRGHTYMAGMLLIELTNPFLPPLVQGVKAGLGEAGYKELIGIGESRRRIEIPLIESMIDMRMDGVILVAPRLAGEQLATYARQIPMVVIGHHEPQAQAFDTVNADDRFGARLAVEAILAAGLDDVAMVSLDRIPGDEIDVYVQREAGYAEAMRAAGLGDRVRILRCRQTSSLADPGTMLALFGDRLPRAVFCWSDLHAVALVNAARMAGLRVPEDMAIVGYDDIPQGAMPLIGLASINQRPVELGALAARILLERIAGRTDPVHRLLTPELRRRPSLPPPAPA